MTNIDKILSGNFTPTHYPFFWLAGSETVDDVVRAVDRVYSYGCDGITIEPKAFKDFKVHWWELVDAIVKRASELNMKVVIVDESDEIPTGYVFDKLSKPENYKYRRESLIESHTDVIGPADIALVVGNPAMWTKTIFKDEVIGVYLYKRTGVNNEIDISNPVDLTGNIKNGILSCSVPEGNYRIVYLYRSMRYAEIAKDDKIDMLNKDAVNFLIENIHAEYERRYKQYFGNTIIGFFSDEPEVGNAYPYCGEILKNHEYTAIGTAGRTLPYNDLVKAELEKLYGKGVNALIPSLWYWDENVSPKFRDDYMNIISNLYKECFSKTIGKWCEDRGLIYIGHVLEDGNLHTRLGDGPAHYFRSQEGQTIPGMDIVLHQIMPGHADINVGGYGTKLYNSEFYHYILGKLGSSMAHTYEKCTGKAMCEVTIGYGWAEGSQLAKWLVDYLLVRGTNFFVTGAIRPVFPDLVHAPHFGDNDGREPQELGYAKIIQYSKKVVSALDEGKHVANALLMYHAHGEWMSNKDYMYMQRPAKVLYDNHIDFDILSEDLLDKIKVENGKCTIKETYDCIVVPYAKYLPEQMIKELKALKEKGADIVFVDALPAGVDGFSVVELENIADYFTEKGYVDIQIDNFHTLRHYHVNKDGVDVYLFTNEDAHRVFNGEIKTGKSGNYNVYDFVSDKYYRGIQGDNVRIRLEPYQSCVVVYEQDRGFEPYVDYDCLTAEKILAEFDTKLYFHSDMTKVIKEYKQTTLNAVSNEYPDFSGKIVYQAKVNLEKKDKAFIRLSSVGENAILYLNGINCGHAICKPFVYDVSKALKDGENQLEIQVFTTLANSERDPVSMFVPMVQTGVSGDIEFLF